tara:strand:- start:106 stop:1221 length:1116 start_codon:yes stop_codon:yes gene_type:complete
MGFFSKLKNELVDIIEWDNDEHDIISHKFDRADNEIKNGAQLIVREGQKALFVEQGQLADVFGPGTYTLATENLPVLSTLKGWKHGFESPFKAEVIFISTTRFIDQKSGTPNEIPMRDADFGFVNIRAFGSYGFVIAEPEPFLKKVIGTDKNFMIDELEGQLRSIIISQFSISVVGSGTPVMELAMKYAQFSEEIKEALGAKVAELGIEIVDFNVENISLPEAVQEAINKRSSMGAIGDMNTFNQYQTGVAMENISNNPGQGGNMSSMMGMGVGVGMAGNMMNQMNQNQQQQQQQQVMPPPMAAPVAAFFFSIDGQQLGPYTMDQIKQMATNNQISRDTMAWRDGMPQWTQVQGISELQSVFGTVPPPMPG